MLFSLNLKRRYFMYSTTNTSLRNAMDDLRQALDICFGEEHQSKAAITQLKETIESIERRLTILALSTDEMISNASSDESFAPDAVTDAEQAGVTPPNAVPKVVIS